MFGYPHRTFCSTLEEQRRLVRTINIFNYKRVKAILLSLIEENQTYGNRMEAGLEYGDDLDNLHKKRKELRKEVKSLEKQVKALRDEAGVEEEPEEELTGRSFRQWLSSREDD